MRGNLTVGRALRLVLTNVGGGRPGRNGHGRAGHAREDFVLRRRAARRRSPFHRSPNVRAAMRTRRPITVMAADGPDHGERSSLGDARAPPRSTWRIRYVTWDRSSPPKPGPAALLARTAARSRDRERGVERWRTCNVFSSSTRAIRSDACKRGGEWDPTSNRSHSVRALRRSGRSRETLVPALASPESLLVVVTGGDTGGFSAIVTSWPASMVLHRFVDADGSYSAPRAARKKIEA